MAQQKQKDNNNVAIFGIFALLIGLFIAVFAWLQSRKPTIVPPPVAPTTTATTTGGNGNAPAVIDAVVNGFSQIVETLNIGNNNSDTGGGSDDDRTTDSGSSERRLRPNIAFL